MIDNTMIDGTINRMSRSTSLKRTPLNDLQQTRIFACICVARYIHGYRDDEENFSLDVYKKTIGLLKPHLKHIALDHEPPFHVVRKIWRDFFQTGLIITTNRESKYPYSDSIDGDSHLSEDSSEQENEEFLPRSRGRRRHSKEPKDSSNSTSSTIFSYGILSVLLLFSLCFILIFAQENSTILKQKFNNIKIQYDRIDELRQEYPGSISGKKSKIIKVRATMMQDEISILLLLGQRHDKSCRYDKTYCIGRAIANVTELPYGYLDASDPNLNSSSIVSELSNSFIDGQRYTVLFDSLEQLSKKSEVMSLFQFIDKDGTNRRRGLLIFTVYVGDDIDAQSQHRLQDFDLVEKILLKRWSSLVPNDTLTSVISRISGSIVRTY